MTTKSRLLVLIGVLALCASDVLGQEIDEQQEFKKARVAFSIGQGYIPQADNNSSNFLILPTIGLDFQYRMNEKWGVSLKSDIEIANYLVEDNDENKLERENPLIVSIPVTYSPWENGFSFFMGPGIEIEENENFFILRLGVGKEFELGNEWDFSPEFIYDLKNGSINSFTIAFGVGKKF